MMEISKNPSNMFRPLQTSNISRGYILHTQNIKYASGILSGYNLFLDITRRRRAAPQNYRASVAGLLKNPATADEGKILSIFKHGLSNWSKCNGN